MPRFEIPGDPIHVTYGHDELAGVFLSVFDERISWSETATKEVNDVTHKVGLGDGGGSYFDLHTGTMGFGVKVDEETMATYLRRYGVTDDKIISQLPLNLKSTLKGRCLNCKTGRFKCSSCGVMKYCSKNCQTEDWALHKLFCNAKKKPSSDGSWGGENAGDPARRPRSVQAYFFPEESREVELVWLPCKYEEAADDDDFGYWDLDTSEYVHFRGVIRSNLYPDQDTSLNCSYKLFHEDGFLINGRSKVNECMKRIITKKVGLGDLSNTHWKGNLLLVKADKQPDGENDQYENITVQDIPDAIKFITDITSSYTHKLRR
eukprot:GHVN01017085.1.p1 GENE.GHVN01017085.1~~GHVN01017085.1.p1  ORF type:complete len:319 (+),score=31.93 GHVN01017085.1:254-1210(+)